MLHHISPVWEESRFDEDFSVVVQDIFFFFWFVLLSLRFFSRLDLTFACCQRFEYFYLCDFSFSAMKLTFSIIINFENAEIKFVSYRINSSLLKFDIFTLVHSIYSPDITATNGISLSNDLVEFRIFR